MHLITNDMLYDKFFNRRTLEVRDSIWDQVTRERLRTIVPEAHEANVFCDFFKRAEHRDVLPGWVRLPPLSVWSYDGAQFEETARALPPRECASLASFLQVAAEFFATLGTRKIAVQLSGGLDTSIVIGLMRELGVPHALIGLSNARYEFRTESRIQQLLAEGADQCVLISHESCLPYSALKTVPPHQLPGGDTITFAADRAMAGRCAELGIEVLISGAGGDVLLTGPVSAGDSGWKPSYFYNAFLRQYAYGPEGVDLLPFFADPDIAACVRSLRMGKGRDMHKTWARDFFSRLLPVELVEYDYKADFWGIYVDGLANARSEISALHDGAFGATGNAYFSREKLDALLSKTLNDCDASLYKHIDARVSLATWLHGVSAGARSPSAEGGS